MIWATATEIDNDRFVVEKSHDNKLFTEVGTVKGALNSKVRAQYSLLDVFAAKDAMNSGLAKVYYRINQIDVSGKNKHSNSVAVNLNKNQEAGINRLNICLTQEALILRQAIVW